MKTDDGTGVLANQLSGQIKPDGSKSRLIKVIFMKISLKDKTDHREVAEGNNGRQFWIGLTDLKLRAAAPGAGALRCL